MLLTSTTSPGYVDVVVAAREAGIGLPSHLAQLFLLLATYYPEIRPTASALALSSGSTVRTVERNLSELAKRGQLASVTMKRGTEHGATSWRFLVLPTLTPVGDAPLLAGRGPACWDHAPLEVGKSLRLTVAHDGRCVEMA
jgi:hypothetical protein